jgi:hypothetical protein
MPGAGVRRGGLFETAGSGVNRRRGHAGPPARS